MPSAEGVAGAAAPSTPNTPCEKVKGTWSAQVAADVGWNWGKDRPTKALIVEGRSVKVWAALAGSEISGDGWVAWNMNAPTEQDGACVYTVHDTVYGEGFNKDGVKPYDVVRTVTLTPADGGIDMKITHDPPVFVAGGPAKAVVEGWFKAFDGSFWKDAPPELKSGTR
jgi:hypothetical protein